MKIRFFGDSWAWIWFHDKNKELFKNILSLEKSNYTSGVSFLKIILESMGHEVTIHNRAGTGPKDTKEVIRETLSNLSSSEDEYWVWQISCSLRNDKYDSFDFSSLDGFLKSYDARTLEHLQEVNDMDIPDNIHICLMGSHTELPKRLFESISNKSNNLHYMCRNFYKEMCTPDLGLNFQPQEIPNQLIDRFGRCSERFFNDYVFPYGDDYKDYFHSTVLEFFIECSKYSCPNNIISWPDPGHLGFSGHVLLVEYVLKFIEDLKSRNA